MTQLTIVANIYTHPDQIGLVQFELEKLVPITRLEAGCLKYDLHRDNSNPAHLMFYETWASRELWQTHMAAPHLAAYMAAPHLAAYMAATDGAVTEFTLNEMTQIA